MPLIPALGRQRQVGFRVQGQPGLQSEFQDSLGYTEKPCLGKKEKKRKEKKKEKEKKEKKERKKERKKRREEKRREEKRREEKRRERKRVELCWENKGAWGNKGSGRKLSSHQSSGALGV
jgi:outer membrane biosynthesis protein TonB